MTPPHHLHKTLPGLVTAAGYPVCLTLKQNNMVTIIDYKRNENSEQKEFFSLQVQGGIEPVQSKSGSFYLTARSCWITTTFTEEMCRALIGTKMPGHVAKVPCDPYEYTLKGTEEVLVLDYQWRYLPEETEEAMKPEPAMVIPHHLVVA
jgi:hypothetical protein